MLRLHPASPIVVCGRLKCLFSVSLLRRMLLVCAAAAVVASTAWISADGSGGIYGVTILQLVKAMIQLLSVHHDASRIQQLVFPFDPSYDRYHRKKAALLISVRPYVTITDDILSTQSLPRFLVVHGSGPWLWLYCIS